MNDDHGGLPPSSNPKSPIANPKSTPPRPALLAVAFAAFVSLGLPDGVLGVAWPSVRTTFALQHSQLGLLLTASMLGYLTSSAAGGTLVGRFGVGRVLLGSSVMVVAAVLGYASAPA